MIRTDTRNATLADLATLLQDQHARKVDVVAPAASITSEDGVLVIKGTEAVLDDDGVTQSDGRYRPTTVCDEGIAEKLSIPVAYVRRMRAERPDLFDRNVNGWLHGRKPLIVGAQRVTPEEMDTLPRNPHGAGWLKRPAIPGDDRSFLVRCFRGDDGGEGVARAFLSDRYALIDNLDALTAALAGVKDAGVEVEIDGCDLTDRRMYVRVKAPAVQLLAPTLLGRYRSPFTGASGADNPTVFAGFVISNSETGGGAFTITPRLVIQVCSNGMTITKDALRAVHLGGRQDEGVIRWSEDTQRKTIDLITAKTRDAVATFLDVEYMRKVIDDVEEKSTAQIGDVQETVKVVGKALSFDKDTIAGVLDHFIRGGDPTAGGLMGAVTSYAQTVGDADAAHEIESQALRALDLAAARG